MGGGKDFNAPDIQAQHYVWQFRHHDLGRRFIDCGSDKTHAMETDQLPRSKVSARFK